MRYILKTMGSRDIQIGYNDINYICIDIVYNLDLFCNHLWWNKVYNGNQLTMGIYIYIVGIDMMLYTPLAC